jgi:hypothetical protein
MSGSRIANLVIAGVPKAATGSLFAYLAQHPDVCGSDVKATGYFNFYSPWRRQGPPPPAVKRRAESVSLLPPAARQRLRPGYARLNAGELGERPDPALRRHVEDLYRKSNEVTAELLVAHGYRDLPGWLRGGPAS